jgi:predicted flavoprotein YhiN
MSDKNLRAFAATLQPWSFMPGGTVGYHKAEVTRGGVSTEALNQKDLQAKAIPGLYFCGEVVDVTGQLGGFNFQWAWASGAAVGRAI